MREKGRYNISSIKENSIVIKNSVLCARCKAIKVEFRKSCPICGKRYR